MDRRAIQFALAACLAPALSGVAGVLALGADDRAMGLGMPPLMLAALAVGGLTVPGLAVAHLRGWMPPRLAAAGMAGLLLPVGLVSLFFPAAMPVSTLGLGYAMLIAFAPSDELRAAAAHAFPASSELRSLRAAWAYLPGAVRLAAQVAGSLVLVVGSVVTAGLFATGMLSGAAAPGTGGLAGLGMIVAAAGLVVTAGVMALVGIPPLILVSPFGGFTRGRVQRWVAARAGVPAGRLGWGAHLGLSALGVLAAIFGITALVMTISGIGAVSVGAITAMPAWLGLALVLVVRSHLAELFSLAPGRVIAVVRRNPGELLIASTFQVLGLTWLIGLGAFLGLCVSWALLLGPDGDSGAPYMGLTERRLWPAWGTFAAAACVQGWVTVRSLVTLTLLRVTLVQRLVAKDAATPATAIDPAGAVR